MKLLACVAVPALLATLFLAGCEAPANVPRAAAQRDRTQAETWIARRESQLKQMGLKDGDAAMKARDEWRDLGNSTESYTLYDSAAKQKAEQEKFESDLAKAPRN
ncbi:MAG: hypothetical protein HYV96_02665 [Opitutae bacterium]|nr:hypothetical protein [Opitutae bacterium]